MLFVMLMAALSVTALGNALPQVYHFEERGIDYKLQDVNKIVSFEIDCHFKEIHINELPCIFNETYVNHRKSVIIKNCQLSDESFRNISHILGTRDPISKLTLLNIPLIKREHFDQVSLIDIVTVINSYVVSDAFIGMSHCDTIQLHTSTIFISNASSSEVSDLRSLAIKNCNITLLSPDTIVTENDNLTILDMEKTFITEATNTFFESFKSLSELSLSEILLTSLPNYFLRCITTLELLYINANQLKEISSYSMTGSNVNMLYVIDNTMPLSLAPRALADSSRLREIFLRNNTIKVLPADLLQGSDNVEALDLSHNLIQELPDNIFVNKSNLVAIYLNNNQLHKLSAATFAFLPSMKWLYLNNNAITELSGCTFSSMTSLVKLELQNNRLRSVQPNSFPASLEILILDNNKLTTIETIVLPRLRKLLLSNNLFSSVPVNWRDSFPALRYINLEGNAFTQLTAADFVIVPHYTGLRLDNNKIRSVYVNRNTTLPSFLSLKNNQLRCDCWMHAFATSYRVEIGKLHDEYCSEPASYNSTRLTTVALIDLVCHLEPCPDTCSCIVIPENKALEVKCGKQLTEEQLKNLEYIRQKHYNDITDNMIFVLGN